MIRFAVLNIKDIINKLIILVFVCIFVYVIGVVGIKEFNSLDTFKRYISYNILVDEKNSQYNTIEAFMRYMLCNELYLLKNNENIQITSNNIEQGLEKNPIDNSSDEINTNNELINSQNIKICDINSKEYNIENNVNNIAIKNKTNYEIDYNKMVNGKCNLFTNQIMPTILIIHTHGSESYTGVEHTDYYRNEDKNLNVVRVGEELAKILKNSGYDVIHDKRLYDYPTYSGSYTRALSSIQQYINDNINTQIVLDIHRDAIASDEKFAPSTNIDGNRVSQIMIIVGTDEGGLSHPEWKENLKLALQLYNTAYQIYPDLFRNLNITKSRYNQHTTKGSLILEVGATGNTLEESVLAIRYFSKILDETLKNNWGG